MKIVNVTSVRAYLPRPFSRNIRRMAAVLFLAACLSACGAPGAPEEAGPQDPSIPGEESYGEEAQSPEASQEETSLAESTSPAEEPAAVSSGPISSGNSKPSDEDPSGWIREIRVSNPGQGYFYGGEAPKESRDALQLELLTERPNAITDEEEWFDGNGLPDLTVPVPNPDWGETGELPAHIPQTLDGGLRIIQLGLDESYQYALYGEQYWDAYLLCIYDKSTLSLLCTLDFSSYRYGTQDSGWEQRIWWARICGGLLVFSVGHGTYAESMPYHAYLGAVSLTDGMLLWKSEPLVSNAYNFEIVGDVILSGYGFTAEDDYLYQLDLRTGRILNQLPVKTKPDYIIRLDDILYVRTYNTNYTFRILGLSDDAAKAPSAYIVFFPGPAATSRTPLSENSCATSCGICQSVTSTSRPSGGAMSTMESSPNLL